LPQRCPGTDRVAKRTLNDRILKSLKPAEAGRRYDVLDAIVPGLAIRVGDKGMKTFVLIARFGGAKQPTRRALGEYGAMSLEQARIKARKWLEMIRSGVDPKADEARRKLEQLRKQKNTFASVAEDFIKRHVSKNRTAAAVEREIRREFIGRWGARSITEITQHDIAAMLDEVVDRGAPYQAHNLLSHVRRLFNWAVSRGSYGIEHSPCDRLKPRDAIGERHVRQRVLKDAELRAFWKATERLGYPFGPLFKMLLVTGQRRSEVADAVWSEFDIEGKLWTIPASRMKSNAAHVVPLTADAIAILESLPRFKRGDHVFSTTFGERPVSGFSKAKVRIDALMKAELGELDEWRLHDLRRSMRTGLSALPVTDLVRELAIAHTKPGLHKVYDQHAYLDEKREALTLWAARLRSIVEPPPDNVVALHTATAS
jgi:integrase